MSIIIPKVTGWTFTPDSSPSQVTVGSCCMIFFDCKNLIVVDIMTLDNYKGMQLCLQIIMFTYIYIIIYNIYIYIMYSIN